MAAHRSVIFKGHVKQDEKMNKKKKQKKRRKKMMNTKKD